MHRFVSCVVIVVGCDGRVTFEAKDARSSGDAPAVRDAPAIGDAPRPLDGSPPPDVGPPPDADLPVDGPVLAQLPDLTLVHALMTGTAVIIPETFTAESCAVIEGCVDPGTRRLLRFDVASANFGDIDLVMGAPPPPGVSEGLFTWSGCHQHHHVAGFASYELRSGDVVVKGRKQAFCLMDVARVVPGSPTHGYTCENQGLSVGWADVYESGLPCQWIDVTGLPSGTYTLRIEVNPEGIFQEKTHDNNVWTETVQI